MRLVYVFSIAAILIPGCIYGYVAGRVFSELDSTELSGANIYISNTSLGTVSDQNGEFELSHIPDGDYEINIEYVGYATKKVHITIPLENPYLIIYMNQEIVNGPMVSVVATMACSELINSPNVK